MQQYSKHNVVDIVEFELLPPAGDLSPDCLEHLIHHLHLIARLDGVKESLEGFREHKVVGVDYEVLCFLLLLVSNEIVDFVVGET